MHARVLRVKIPPEGDREQAIAAIREQAVPALRAMRGFRGAYWLADRQAGEGLNVLLWDDEQAAREAEEAIRPRREEMMRQSGAVLLEARDYEVVAEA